MKFNLSAAAASLALAMHGPALAETSRTTTTVGDDGSYRCDASPSGECFFLLYGSDCKDGPARNGAPTLECTHFLVREFTLKAGESRKFDDLPAKVEMCITFNGKLRFPDCKR
ncbi:hypothetical protein [Massilia sp. DD77]|uniref:hypothetical protein n=1 Tax=Massilia sp. DD77 TaxID=3109349 RepID=UPI002FFE9101